MGQYFYSADDADILSKLRIVGDFTNLRTTTKASASASVITWDNANTASAILIDEPGLSPVTEVVVLAASLADAYSGVGENYRFGRAEEATLNGYVGLGRSSDRQSIDRFAAGSFAARLADNRFAIDSNDKLHWHRLQIISNTETGVTTLKSRLWDTDESEPTTWTMETTDNTAGFATSGLVAFFRSSYAPAFRFIGIGTNGDPAPTAPVAGGGITGNGSHQSQPSTHSAAGERTITGSGSHSAQSASHSGAGVRSITGAASHQAQPSASTGAGVREVDGAGSHAASAATHSGSGGIAGNVSGSGSHQSAAATHSGSGVRLIEGQGNHQAAASTHDGLGALDGAITGQGSHQSQPAAHTGAGRRIVSGIGSAQAAPAIGQGQGVRVMMGNGSHAANDATHTGAGSTTKTIIGSGTHQAEPATHSGSSAPVLVRPIGKTAAVEIKTLLDVRDISSKYDTIDQTPTYGIR